MHEACPHCGRPFQRGPGFFLGSIYFNYGVTALLVTVMYFAFFFTEVLTDRQLLALTLTSSRSCSRSGSFATPEHYGSRSTSSGTPL